MVQTQVHVYIYVDYRLWICEISNSTIINGSSNLRIYKYLGKNNITIVSTKS